MSDIALANAEKRRDELLVRIDAARTRIEELADQMRVDREGLTSVVNFIRQWHEMAGIDPPKDAVAVNVPASPPAIQPTDKPKRRKNSDKTEVAAVAAEILLKAGRPLPRSLLFDKLIEAGLTIEGKDPQMVLSTMLWRMPDIVTRIDGFGYWPTGVPCPMAGYAVDNGQTSLQMS